MDRTRSSRLARLIAVGAVVALLVAVLAYPLALWIDAGAVEVQQIRAFDEAAVRANRALFEEGEPVAEIYGALEGEPVRLVFVDADRILRPQEDPSLALYPKREGENPLQAHTVRYVGRMTAFGAAAAALGLGLLLLLLRRRARRAA